MAYLPQLISQGMNLMDRRQTNNLGGILSEFLHSNGINMEEVISPSVDITETSTTISVYVNLPGVKPNSIDVDFYNNRVDIKGERPIPHSDTSSIITNEIMYGSFERKIMLPISVTSSESVTIKSENGVLIISIDKVREERNRFSVRVSDDTHSD